MTNRGCEAVGIDLGTTYSSLAYLDARLVPCVVADTSGHTVIPSVIYFDDQSIIVGDAALELSKTRSERAVQFVKLQMGEDWRFVIDGQEHTPESLSAIILAHLIREAEPQIGPARRAVITVPAWFTEKRRRATEQAGRIAGLDVLGTLNEPMAAALAYGLHRVGDSRPGKPPAEQNVLVYDLGGGTLDVTVMRITPTELIELATRGNRKLGGKDWDEALMRLALDGYQKQTGRDPGRGPDAPAVLHEVRLECERAKRRLSQTARTAIPVRAGGQSISVDVTRADFEAATDALIQSSRNTVEIALEDARLNWDRIDRVVLVGGSTHMPMVRAMLQQVSGKPPDRGINPVSAVALGAAIYAHMLETGNGPRPVAIDRPAVQFVTAHGIGVRTNSGNEPGNAVLIPRNTPVPTTVHRRFLTKKAGAGPASGIRVVVTQGDTPHADLAEVVGTARITGIPPNDRPGQPVVITMAFDTQSRLHLYALYKSTGQQLHLDLDIPGGLREEEVQHYHNLLVTTGLVHPVFAPPEPLDDDFLPLDDDDDDPLLQPLD